MPKIIRHALYQKVSQLPDLRQFQEDFALLTGLRIAFLDNLGQVHTQTLALGPLCRHVQNCPTSAGICPATHQQLVAAASERPACITCDAGLQEAAVAVRISGIVVGYLAFVGTLAHKPIPQQTHRVAHLLRRDGLIVPDDALSKMLARTRTIPPPLMQAYLRILESAAHHIAHLMTAHFDQASASLPPLVAHACRIIRRQALTQSVSLDEVAAECRVSVSHLSRVFHHGAGMTFREYVARWRAEHAERLLMSTHRPITQIAYESGFQSLSQFNRVFRAIYGQSPRRMRAQRRAAQSAALTDDLLPQPAILSRAELD
jgi:AraC-like DNA-binding protein